MIWSLMTETGNLFILKDLDDYTNEYIAYIIILDNSLIFLMILYKAFFKRKFAD